MFCFCACKHRIQISETRISPHPRFEKPDFAAQSEVPKQKTRRQEREHLTSGVTKKQFKSFVLD